MGLGFFWGDVVFCGVGLFCYGCFNVGFFVDFFVVVAKVFRTGAASIISLLLLGPPAVCLMVLSSLF